MVKVDSVSKAFISAVLKSIPDVSAWPKTSREDVYVMHKDTRTLPLRGQLVNGKFDVENYTKPCADTEFMTKEVQELLDTIFTPRSIGRVMIVALKPRSVVALHKDVDKYFNKYNRYHVPLKTNPNVVFQVEHDNYYLEVGGVYLLDNQKPHAVFNHSDEVRLHLITDIK